MNYLVLMTLFSFMTTVLSVQNFRGTQYTTDALNDQITELPGLTDQTLFNQFSGYLNLPSTKKQIH